MIKLPKKIPREARILNTLNGTTPANIEKVLSLAQHISLKIP